MLEDCERRRVLLVESDQGLRSDLAKALRRVGFPVDAQAGLDALSIQGSKHRYAIAVIDLASRGAREWLLDGADSVPTVLLAGSESDAEAASLRNAQPVYADGTRAPIDVLCKPFSFAALEARIWGMQTRSEEARSSLIDPILESEDPTFKRLLHRAHALAKSDVPISLAGELGTGRLSLARQIHAWSRLANEPCLIFDRARIEASGEGGAFESVRATMEASRSGTLILVDMEDWSSTFQQAILTGLRDAESKVFRTIAVTQQELSESAREGRLSVELQYRLESVSLRVPALRERIADHASLCRRVVRKLARELGMEAPELAPEWIEATSREGFPGNRLGLESRLRSALVRAEGDPARFGLLASRDLVAEAPPSSASGKSSAAVASLNLKELERDTIIRALAHWDGNRTRASESLGISVRTLRNKIRDYALRSL